MNEGKKTENHIYVWQIHAETHNIDLKRFIQIWFHTVLQFHLLVFLFFFSVLLFWLLLMKYNMYIQQYTLRTYILNDSKIQWPQKFHSWLFHISLIQRIFGYFSHIFFSMLLQFASTFCSLFSVFHHISTEFLF